MLKEFCEPFRTLAAQRNLFFHTDGAEQLLVDGDLVKIQRITQNLVTNAIKATERGGVRLTWGDCGTADRPQWVLCVQDTGSGLDPATAAPLEQALKRATDEASEVEHSAGANRPTEPELAPAPTLASRSAHHSNRDLGGEGIGLSIVKRLCELLDASLELETSTGEGTTFRVVFPRHYRNEDRG